MPLAIRVSQTVPTEGDGSGDDGNGGDGNGGDGNGGNGGGGARDRRVLIFANKIKAVGFVASLLHRHGVQCATLSSRLSAREREGTLRRFANGELRVLVAEHMRLLQVRARTGSLAGGRW